MDQLPQLRNELVPGRGTVVCERERTQRVEKVLVSGSGEAVGSQVCSVDLSASGGGALRRLSSDRQGPGVPPTSGHECDQVRLICVHGKDL